MPPRRHAMPFWMQTRCAKRRILLGTRLRLQWVRRFSVPSRHAGLIRWLLRSYKQRASAGYATFELCPEADVAALRFWHTKDRATARLAPPNRNQPPYRFTGKIDKLTVKLVPLKAAEEKLLQKKAQDTINKAQ
jgi:hypothetical protein